MIKSIKTRYLDDGVVIGSSLQTSRAKATQMIPTLSSLKIRTNFVTFCIFV